MIVDLLNKERDASGRLGLEVSAYSARALSESLLPVAVAVTPNPARP